MATKAQYTPLLHARIGKHLEHPLVQSASKLSPAIKARVEEAQKGLVEGRKHHPAGRINLAPSTLHRVIPAMAQMREPANKAERHALTGLLGVHELHERNQPARHVVPVYSHLHPEVLLKEHNAVSTLSGPGADYAREVLRKARHQTGEHQHMRNLLQHAFGERAGQFLREGEKVPKAMMRALRKKLQTDPELIARSAPDLVTRAGATLAGMRALPALLRR
jgi:hypothetical protein